MLSEPCQPLRMRSVVTESRRQYRVCSLTSSYLKTETAASVILLGTWPGKQCCLGALRYSLRFFPINSKLNSDNGQRGPEGTDCVAALRHLLPPEDCSGN